MGLHDFLRHWIETNMEEPRARDRKIHDHMNKRLAVAKRMREDYTLPMKAWGYWKDSYATASYNRDTDAGVRSLPGRIPPMDTDIKRVRD